MGAGRPLTLRVYDVTTHGDVHQPDQSYDVQVSGSQGRWYLDFWRDDRTFVADIGYAQPDGTFSLLARSNAITTPPSQPSPGAVIVEHEDPNGAMLQTELPVIAPTPDNASAGHLPGAIEPAMLLNKDFPAAEWLEQALQQDIASTNPAAAAGESLVAFVEPDEHEEAPPDNFPDVSVLLEHMVENRTALQAFYDAVESLTVSAKRDDAPQVSAETAPMAEPGEASLAEASEKDIGISSMEFVATNSDMEVHVELHIHGKTTPHRELTLYGERIVAGPDGRFYIKRALPDGSIILPFQ